MHWAIHECPLLQAERKPLKLRSLAEPIVSTVTSHCPEHKWGSALALPGKRSIFYLEDEQQAAEDDIEDNAKCNPGYPKIRMKNPYMSSSQDTEQDVSSKPPWEDQREAMARNCQEISGTKPEDIKDSMQEKATEALGNKNTCIPEMDLLAKNFSKENSNSTQFQGDSGLSKFERNTEPKRSTKAVPLPSRTTGNKEKNVCNKSSSDITKNAIFISRLNSKLIADNKRARKTTPMPSKGEQQPASFDSSDSEPLDDTKAIELKAIHKLTLDAPPMEDKKQEDPRGSGPFFYIGGRNGAQLVNDYCTSKGWQQLQDRKRDDYKLKWCESKCASNYYCFKAGEQLLYQIPNNKVLTTKIGLLTSLREYERVMNKVYKFHQPRLLRLDEFFPETFRMDLKEERDAFFSLYKGGQIWICKPTSLNQGRGIFLLKTKEDVDSLRTQLESLENDPTNRKLAYKFPQAKIVQRYIQNPLLLEGRKFDVRSYLLIACTVPYVVFFRHGYVRLTCNNYDPNSDDLTGHLTNQYMQKKNPQYKLLKEETVWSMERFNTYVNENFMKIKGLPGDWVLNLFTKRMQQIMMQCFLAVKSKLECKLGYFDLIGCDFLIDEEFKVWVLEMNSNPALHTNCQVLKNIIPSVVNETLDLSLETFHKSLKGQRILPLETQRSFVLLYNGEFPEQNLKFTRIKPSVGAFRIQRSSKPEGDTEQVLKTSKGLDKPQKTAVAHTKNSSPKPTLNQLFQKSAFSLPQVQIYELSRAVSAKSKGSVLQLASSVDATKQKTLPEEQSAAELCKDKSYHAITVPLLIEQVIPIPQHLQMLGNKSPVTRKSHNTASINTIKDLAMQLQSKIRAGQSFSELSACQHSLAKTQCRAGEMASTHDTAACAADCFSASAAAPEDAEPMTHRGA